ncbi:D-glycerate dehydrogenase [Rugamonas sp.]|uniref:2-hydroxyacid dehydrogenase n=1 Tax=Rugamonas sp. TaxID=1926287 RepID=UPI0025CEAB42|nr:D-glycerate dehydrogenase [Rugamonas sp.]
MTARLLCATPLPPAIAERARAEFDAITSQDHQPTVAEAIAALRAEAGLQAMLISSRIRLDAAAVAALPAQLKLIACYSVGYEHVDVAAAKARGIVVTNTPDVVSDATADMALLLMLGACRRARDYAAIMERGWRQRYGLGDMLGLDFSGKTLGIIGMGRIGQAVARRARGFGVKVLYHNRRRLAPELEQGATYFDDVRAMLPHCQILSLHAPGERALDGYVDAAMMALLPRGAVLVNTSRGLLVNEDDLIAALQSGQLAAAGLDVFRAEPEYDLRLRELPNIFMMPHMGTATVETRDAMGHRALDNVAAVLAGAAPRDAV